MHQIPGLIVQYPDPTRLGNVILRVAGGTKGVEVTSRTHSRSRLWLGIWLIWAALFSLVSPAQSQVDANDEVDLTIQSFGVGGLAREGEWAGILVTMQDSGSSSRDIVLRIEIPDVDGDITQFDRVVTANPGVLQSFWLYAQIPFQSIGDEYALKAFEAIDSGGSNGPEEIGFRAGRLLGMERIVNPRIQSARVGMMGVVGTNQLGLDQYGIRFQNQPWMPLGHELQMSSAGLTIDNVPDRWHGLKTLNTIVWASATTSSYDPSRLTPEKARAIREWVERGGHLVIVLQSSGDPWYQGTHPLRAILPAIKTPERREGVSLEPYRTLLTESDRGELPRNATVYSFEPLDSAEMSEAFPILNGPNQETVVIRRILGSGMVTVVGLPLNHGRLRQFGLPDAESLWHRVIGLRGEILPPEAMNDVPGNLGSRDAQLFDDGVSDAISKTGTAVQGVLFGIIVFIVYWLVAGPVGYAILKQRKKPQHAWMLFVVSIAGFTTIAWLGATTLRPKRVTISHFSVLQAVDGQSTQRVRSWFSVMLPSYGNATISSADPDEQGGGFGSQESNNLLIPWSAPESGGTLTGGFPDNSGYRVQARSPAAVNVPTRATVKTFTTEWAGEPNWSMPFVVGDLGDSATPRLSLDGQVVTGKIAHRLPGALKDVRVFVNSREAPINRVGQELGRRMIAQVAVFAPSFGENGWGADQSVDMRDITSLNAETRRSRDMDYFQRVVGLGVDTTGLPGSREGSLSDRVIAGMFLSQFEPPRFNVNTNDVVGEKLAMRRLMHGWDLGRWFTQPSVIVVGVLEVDADDASEDGMPAPIWVNGRRVPASGTTIVTWVYPLDPEPPVYLDQDASLLDEQGDGEG